MEKCNFSLIHILFLIPIISNFFRNYLILKFPSNSIKETLNNKQTINILLFFSLSNFILSLILRLFIMIVIGEKVDLTEGMTGCYYDSITGSVVDTVGPPRYKRLIVPFDPLLPDKFHRKRYDIDWILYIKKKLIFFLCVIIISFANAFNYIYFFFISGYCFINLCPIYLFFSMIFSRILYKRLYFHHQKILIGIMFIIFIIQFFIRLIIDTQFVQNNFNFIIYGLIFNIVFAFQNSFERYILEIFYISYKPVPYILMYQSLFSFIIYYIYFYYSGKLILEVNFKEYIFNLLKDTTKNFGMDELKLILLLCSIFIFNYSKFIYNIYISSCDWMLMENIYYFII